MLTIEDGTIIAGANSFTTDVELLAYAAARGVTLPATEVDRDILQIKSIDYLFSKELSMAGCRINSTQTLPYPRFGVVLNGFQVAIDSIPQNLKNAQMEAAIQAVSSPLLTNATINNVQREKLDTLEIEYFDGGKWTNNQFDAINAYLRPLLKRTNTLARV